MLINSQSLSFEVLSFSLQAKVFTVGCISKTAVPIFFIVRSPGLICFQTLSLRNPGASLNNTESLNLKRRYRTSFTFKNDDTESFLKLNTEQKRRYRRLNCRKFFRFCLE